MLSNATCTRYVEEGGKKGVEIEGAADTSGLSCFCTRMISSNGDIRLLQAAMVGHSCTNGGCTAVCMQCS